MKVDISFFPLKFETGEEVSFDTPSIKRTLHIPSSKFLKASLQLEAVFMRIGLCEARLFQLCYFQPFSGHLMITMQYSLINVIGKINLLNKNHRSTFEDELKNILEPIIFLEKVKSIPILRFDVEKNHFAQKKFNPRLN